ncbi:hypothetical protein L8O25_19575 [Enterobacter asburiae]|uniref:hypothetical protein n=1 Tax=Enterobacter asburiae TaxID=61645 RepID=UPI002002C083|nr:hypothetical protein [Enterobacter asburiae]MCK7264897.1 hypothetical protein [Enterobacter asburiae]
MSNQSNSQRFTVEMSCDVQNLSDVQREIGQLKMVIGFILAKLQPIDRQNVINELQSWGLPDSAKEFDQFVNPRLRS